MRAAILVALLGLAACVDSPRDVTGAGAGELTASPTLRATGVVRLSQEDSPR